jgi:hypothetical protein
VPRGFDTHCSSVPSVDGSSRRELFEFEHSLSIGGAVWAECGGSNLLILLVPGGGVEPPRGCPRRILSPLRLPVPPSRLLSEHPRRTIRSAVLPQTCAASKTSVSLAQPRRGRKVASTALRLVSRGAESAQNANFPRAAPDIAPACHPAPRRLSP